MLPIARTAYLMAAPGNSRFSISPHAARHTPVLTTSSTTITVLYLPDAAAAVVWDATSRAISRCSSLSTMFSDVRSGLDARELTPSVRARGVPTSTWQPAWLAAWLAAARQNGVRRDDEERPLPGGTESGTATISVEPDAKEASACTAEVGSDSPSAASLLDSRAGCIGWLSVMRGQRPGKSVR